MWDAGYVAYINHSYGTSGTLWEGRYKASLVDAERYLLTCMRYIELNPVRANRVKSPSAYRWSSYRANALGKPDTLVTPHALYQALGRTRTKRHERYRALFHAPIDARVLTDIRAACQTGTPLGEDAFKATIERKLHCKVGQARRGRPKRPNKGL